MKYFKRKAVGKISGLLVIISFFVLPPALLYNGLSGILYENYLQIYLQNDMTGHPRFWIPDY